MRRLFALSVLLVSACGGQQAPVELYNVVPSARLAAPLYAPIGEPVVLDASASFDPDGAVVDYTFSFSDGARQVTQPLPEVTHTFTQPGAYEVAVLVRDDGGQLGRAAQLVIVRSDPPTCVATSECDLGNECMHARCYATGPGLGQRVGECLFDPDCGAGLTCRAGVCVRSGPAATP